MIYGSRQSLIPHSDEWRTNGKGLQSEILFTKMRDGVTEQITTRFVVFDYPKLLICGAKWILALPTLLFLCFRHMIFTK